MIASFNYIDYALTKEIFYNQKNIFQNNLGAESVDQVSDDTI